MPAKRSNYVSGRQNVACITHTLGDLTRRVHVLRGVMRRRFYVIEPFEER